MWKSGSFWKVKLVGPVRQEMALTNNAHGVGVLSVSTTLILISRLSEALSARDNACTKVICLSLLTEAMMEGPDLSQFLDSFQKWMVCKWNLNHHSPQMPKSIREANYTWRYPLRSNTRCLEMTQRKIKIWFLKPSLSHDSLLNPEQGVPQRQDWNKGKAMTPAMMLHSEFRQPVSKHLVDAGHQPVGPSRYAQKRYKHYKLWAFYLCQLIQKEQNEAQKGERNAPRVTALYRKVQTSM